METMRGKTTETAAPAAMEVKTAMTAMTETKINAMGDAKAETAHETLIIVDDDKTNLIVAKNNLDERYNVFTAPSGEKLFQILERVTPDLILLDVEMPGMDGYEIIKRLKADEKTAGILIIFLTARIDPENEVKGLNLGAVDYITKPFSRELLIKRVELHLLLEKQKNELRAHNRSLVGEVDKKNRTVFELQNAILKTMAELIEYRDSITGGHIERTQYYLGQLVDFMKEHGVYTEELEKWNISLLIMSSQLHDVGKISIKDGILMKPGKLTGEEFDEMKKHCILGVEIIDKIERQTTENAFLKYAKILAGTHHEKWDGSGYPYGLSGDTIPLQGRLMAIVDVYDALTNDRPYKKALSKEEAIKIITEGKGSHFDPLISDVFLMHSQEFDYDTANSKLGIEYDKLRPEDKIQPTFSIVANIMDIRGGSKKGSVEKVQRYLQILVDALLTHEDYKKEISGWDMGLFLMSAQLHDAGKIVVPDSILNKAGRLTDEEFNGMKAHADFGIKIVQRMKGKIENETLLHHAEVLAGSHHEKWDGTGYPLGLKGEEIPLQGRIMAIIDVYEALTSNRPHRKEIPHKKAVEMIKKNSGTHFDPGIVEAFLACEAEIEKAGKADGT